MKKHVRRFGERINEGFRKRLVGGRGQKLEYDEMGEDQKLELARAFDELSPEAQEAFTRSLSKFGSIAEIRAALMSMKGDASRESGWDVPAEEDRPSLWDVPSRHRQRPEGGGYFYGVPESRSSRVNEGYWGAAMRLRQLEEELSALSPEALKDLRNFLEEPSMLRSLVRSLNTLIDERGEGGEDLGFPGPTRM